ncbi:putative U-box domain-containing protein 33 [Iris pallida]|uniref:RING-type E3 ubiquitin transferase n=1 Tax=Iris pallida TaxID=29817 RepID=A0AAX6HQ45_IRIPA|nr:putative U-box domain-containing protein 33 [Iris pallida]
MSDITFYSYSDIRRATSGLSDISRIGKWRYGSVYKGNLDKREVFVKTLDTEHDQGKDEFLKELKILKEIRHPNLVKLLGACIESRTLVYELLPVLSLEDCLDKNPQLCTWQIRTRIIYQLCSSLIFLYSNHSFPIIHGYLNPSYIYLDTNLNIKVLLPGRSPSTNPRPKGRFTEYIETGNLKLSSDAYSFGVMVLTLLTGLPAPGIKGEVQDEWLRRNIDSKAGSWPFQLAKKLAYFGSKFCNETKNSSAIEIAEELGAILVVIDKFTNKENNEETGQRHRTTSESQGSYSSIIRQTSSQGSDDSIKRQISKDLSNITLFTSLDIERATNGLSESSKIGKWRYGSAYKGYLDNTEMFIKMLDTELNQGIDDFVQELKVLKEISHPNLVKLVGACIESRTLVYEALPDKSLEDCLHKVPQSLTWQNRSRIIYQLCSALIFLYSNRPRPILHGNVKPSSIFLDANLDIKVLIPGRTPTTNPKPKGKFTEYIETGYLKLGSDAYSFGVTVLRLLTGLAASGVEEHVDDACKHEWLKSNVDDTAGSWPFQLVKRLAYFGSKFCSISKGASGPVDVILKDLGIISSLVENYGAISSHNYKDNNEGDELLEEKFDQYVSSSSSSSSGGGSSHAIRKPPQAPKPSNNKVMKRVENSPPPAELVIPKTGGYGSTSRRKSEDTRVKPSFKPFSPQEIHDATNNFSKSLMIGEGGYGKVYKCQLDNWDVAVKILDDQGDQGLKEYIKEMEVLETMRHENLIHLMGTCFKFRALIYEYLPNGSLEDCLKDRPRELTWEIRTRIVYEICTALRFLHAKKPEPLVHGDLKPHNILLGANFEVKLADFGLCRYLTQGENSKAFRQTMHVSGSPGYMDPDFLGSLKVTPGVDVYSLGKTVVRILTGKHPPDVFREVYEAKRAGSFMDIVDPAVRRWPQNVVEILVRFSLKASKPDRNRSEFMGGFHSELEKILDGIDN